MLTDLQLQLEGVLKLQMTGVLLLGLVDDDQLKRLFQYTDFQAHAAHHLGFLVCSSV